MLKPGKSKADWVKLVTLSPAPGGGCLMGFDEGKEEGEQHMGFTNGKAGYRANYLHRITEGV